jgi:hypothetical protein
MVSLGLWTNPINVQITKVQAKPLYRTGGYLTMANTFLAKLVGVSALALGLTVLPSTLPASATATDPAAPTTTEPVAPTTTDAPVNTAPVDVDDDVDGDRDFDWGWLGLLGLIGLAGLTRKHDDTVTRYREPDEVSSSSGPRY